MALHFLLEMTRDFPRALVDELDADLAKRGFPMLSQVQAREWRLIPKVLSRGQIKTDVEYDLLVERLNDVSTSGLSDAELASLHRMVSEYEAVARTRR